MRRRFYGVGIILIATFFASGCGNSQVEASPISLPSIPAPNAILFSPNGGCESTIITEISNATSKIQVTAYVFTNPSIAEALINASDRGVQVEVVLDAGNADSSYCQGNRLKIAGIHVYRDSFETIQHQKNMVVDNSVLVGSYNLSLSAETNSETLLVFRSMPTVASVFAEEFMRHKNHSSLL